MRIGSINEEKMLEDCLPRRYMKLVVVEEHGLRGPVVRGSPKKAGAEDEYVTGRTSVKQSHIRHGWDK